MTTILAIDVVGVPAPQGSKKGFYNPKVGRVQMVESSKKVKPWRQDVRAAALDALAALDNRDPYPLTGPVALTVDFAMPRPGYHFGTGRNAHLLKPNAPGHVEKKPDIDKLLRSTLDALGEAGVWRDDAQVAALTVTKRYADGHTGARITLRPLPVVRTDPAAMVHLHYDDAVFAVAELPLGYGGWQS